MAERAKTVIGWREWLALPELGVPAIKAKIDTGARTSALHAFNIERFVRDGISMVAFHIHPFQRHDEVLVRAEAPLVDRRLVRSSCGSESTRLVIRTTAEVAGRRWPIEITLVNRDALGFRMLLGRAALHRRFIVEPGCSFLAGRPPLALRRPFGTLRAIAEAEAEAQSGRR